MRNIWNGLESDHPTHAARRDHFPPKSQNKKKEPPPKDSALAAAIGILIGEGGIGSTVRQGIVAQRELLTEANGKTAACMTFKPSPKLG